MSGGFFDYTQYKMCSAGEQLEEVIDLVDIGAHPVDYSEETLEEFRKARIALEVAVAYLHRVDWLLSGDDGEETFHERLRDDLLNIFKN